MQHQSQSNQPYTSSIGTQNLSSEGRRTLDDVAQRNGFSLDAILTLVDALGRGNGNQAQFNHWELGGMGQWSQGGMIMIGDMFNNGLKYRVSNLCNELANIIRNQPLYQPVAPAPAYGNVSLFVPGTGATEWPADFGYPSTSGAQNNLKYAYFPSVSRLCIIQNGQTRTFDTGSHQISGVSQQQGGDQTLTFTSQYGLVRLTELPEIAQGNQASPPQQPEPFVPQQPEPQYAPQPVYQQPAPVNPPEPASFTSFQSAPVGTEEIVKMIEKIADLHKKNILTNEEFAEKKAELLSRL